MNAEVKTEMDKVIGSTLKSYRKHFGFTQAEMAEKLGISEKYVSRMETGIGGISKETLIKCVNILGVSPNTLFKEFITNPKVISEIEIFQNLSSLSDKKLAFAQEMLEKLKELWYLVIILFFIR